MGWYSSLVFSLPFFTMDVATAWSANGIRVDNTHMRALRAHGNASLLCSGTGLFEPSGEELFMLPECRAWLSLVAVVCELLQCVCVL